MKADAALFWDDLYNSPFPEKAKSNSRVSYGDILNVTTHLSVEG